MKVDMPAHAVVVEASVRVGLDLRGLEGHPLDALRVSLVGDVLRRMHEERGERVVSVVLGDATRAGFAPGWAELAIRQPSFLTPSPAEAESFLGGHADVVVQPVASPQRAGFSARRRLWIGGVTAPHGFGPPPATSPLHGDSDMLALRLALLRVPHTEPAALSLARLHRADQTLQRWRIKVAGWRDMPQLPPPNDSISAIHHAIAVLDTETVLRLLHQLEVDLRSPSGGKFQAFSIADRVLGLDLERWVGKRPR